MELNIERRGLAAHLISYLLAPLYHLRYGPEVHIRACLSDRIDNCEIRLKRIKSRDGILD